MAKRIDITDKLSFDEKPVLVIKGVEIPVNDDAPTMLKVMGIMADFDAGVSVKEFNEVYELVFPEESREKLDALKLPINDWMFVIEAAVGLITGGEETNLGE